MQIVDCKVKVAANANVGPEVEKIGVSAAEIFVYRHLHGAEAVFDIRPARMDRRSHAQEKERLKTVFRPSQAHDIVEELFPGYSPRLPVSLKDIGIMPDSPFLRDPRRAAQPVQAVEEPLPDEDDEDAVEDDYAPTPRNDLASDEPTSQTAT